MLCEALCNPVSKKCYANKGYDMYYYYVLLSHMAPAAIGSALLCEMPRVSPFSFCDLIAFSFFCGP